MVCSNLEEVGWWTAIQGTVRTGGPQLGTCTAATPPSDIDYMVFHADLGVLASKATVDMEADLSPHRLVWAVLPLMGGHPVPVQRVLKLPFNHIVGPLRQPGSYKSTNNKLDSLETHLSM